MSVESDLGPYIVLPSKNGGADCPCSINLSPDNTYTLANCSCSRNTLFLDSFLAFKWKLESRTTYHVCLLNLTKEMNSTIIHFYELYRVCLDDMENERLKPYRRYFQSLKLIMGKKIIFCMMY